MIANFDLLTIGNATIDIFLMIRKTNKHFRLDKKTNELCLKFGDKVTIDKLDFSIGGNAANVAVGVSRMGLKSAIMAEIGSDEFAPKIISDLRKEGVSEIFLKQTPNAPCRFSVVIAYKKERTVLREDIKRENDFNLEGISAKWIYLTSLEDKWQGAYKRSLIFAKTTGAKIAFNPGTSQLDRGESSIDSILKETDILFVNREEAKTLLSSKTEDVEKLLVELLKLGPKTVVITDGKNGSFLYNKKEGFLKQGIVRQKIISKAGAGDAYASGFLSAIMFGKNFKEAIKWGTLNSASVIGKIGTQLGLLTKKEIEQKL
ncbi:MAG: hypothetical protein A2W22_05785 [Candidatus Levybacteria bacterium RBG_16_35_11]|nr:MAG: hypothetical protein A2W22_05785 [Candidatus Levybacteria bacterium RBG_16_35_11]